MTGGRIRTLKPEWLDDEVLAAGSDSARMLSAALMLMADDYGRGRGSIATVAAEAWRFELERDDGAHARETLAKVSRALQELCGIRFVLLYEVEGQRYFAIRTWKRHQKVDHPSKPRIPEPDPAEWAAFCNPRDALRKPSRESRETLGEVPETLAPHTSDLRPPTSTTDHRPESAATPLESAEAPPPKAPRTRKSPPGEPSPDESAAWEAWCDALDGGKRRPCPAGQLPAIRKALGAYSLDDLRVAFRGVASSEWHMRAENARFRQPASCLSIDGTNAGRIDGHIASAPSAIVGRNSRGDRGLPSDIDTDDPRLTPEERAAAVKEKNRRILEAMS